jgi:transaldolase
VELHTAVARDIGLSEHYGKRFAVLSPDFIVKVPLTPEGLIAANRLQKARVPVNFTLCFSARQNAIAAVFAQPEYVNVFLGRLNAYIENSPAKSCDYLGERATWATQGFLSRTGSPTRLIAASIRSSAQLALLAGVDVLTIPPPVAGDAVEQLDGRWEGYVPDDDAGSSESIVEKTCSISERELEFAEGLRTRPPESGEEVVERAHNSGVGDLFPHLSAEETAAIAADGKIPDHGRWAERLAKGKVALDSLLNLAGLASFSQDQQALDDRIRNVLHEEVKQRA